MAEYFKGINIYMMYDKDNILDVKESPSDDRSKFEYLNNNCILKIR
jgi:hypothetical protein